MRKPLQRLDCVLSFVLLAAVAGCDSPPQTFEIATTINADGSCRRSIYQPKEGYLPLEAISPDWIAQWESISGATAPSDKTPPSQRLTGLPIAGAKYFVAAGTFPSPRDIPAHYHYRYCAQDAPAVDCSELVRDYHRTDFGLLIEYRWSETLTNSVTLDRFLAARDEILDLLLPQITRAMETRTGDDYDVAGLDNYLRSDGRKLAEDLSVACYWAAASHRPGQSIERFIAEVLRQHGIDLPRDVDWDSEAGGKELEDAINRFVTNVITTHLKRRDGKPVAASEVEPFMKKLDELLDAATEEEISRLIPKLVGAYPWFRIIFGSGEAFEFSLRIPGRVCESNGVLLENDVIQWKFDSNQTYPSGYEMRARALDIDVEIQRKVLGRVAIAGTSDALKLIDIVGRQGRILYVVRSALETGDLAPLRDLKAESPEELKRLNVVRSMLHIESDVNGDG